MQRFQIQMPDRYLRAVWVTDLYLIQQKQKQNKAMGFLLRLVLIFTREEGKKRKLFWHGLIHKRRWGMAFLQWKCSHLSGFPSPYQHSKLTPVNFPWRWTDGTLNSTITNRRCLHQQLHLPIGFGRWEENCTGFGLYPRQLIFNLSIALHCVTDFNGSAQCSIKSLCLDSFPKLVISNRKLKIDCRCVARCQ